MNKQNYLNNGSFTKAWLKEFNYSLLFDIVYIGLNLKNLKQLLIENNNFAMRIFMENNKLFLKNLWRKNIERQIWQVNVLKRIEGF